MSYMYGECDNIQLQKYSREICKMFESIAYYEAICMNIKNNNFDWKYMYALVNKSDSYLENEDK